MNENTDYDDMFYTDMPSASVVLGRTLTPRWNWRLSAGISPQRGHASEAALSYQPGVYAPYDFYCALANMDFMLNLVNCFRPYDVRNWFDLYLVFGGGELYKFGMPNRVREWKEEVYPADADNHWFWDAKVGFEGAWHVCRSADLTLELDVHGTDNAYNGVSQPGRKLDWFMAMRLGMVYYFPNKQRHRFANPSKPHYWL